MRSWRDDALSAPWPSPSEPVERRGAPSFRPPSSRSGAEREPRRVGRTAQGCARRRSPVRRPRRADRRRRGQRALRAPPGPRPMTVQVATAMPTVTDAARAGAAPKETSGALDAARERPPTAAPTSVYARSGRTSAPKASTRTWSAPCADPRARAASPNPSVSNDQAPRTSNGRGVPSRARVGLARAGSRRRAPPAGERQAMRGMRASGCRPPRRSPWRPLLRRRGRRRATETRCASRSRRRPRW